MHLLLFKITIRVTGSFLKEEWPSGSGSCWLHTAREYIGHFRITDIVLITLLGNEYFVIDNLKII